MQRLIERVSEKTGQPKTCTQLRLAVYAFIDKGENGGALVYPARKKWCRSMI